MRLVSFAAAPALAVVLLAAAHPPAYAQVSVRVVDELGDPVYGVNVYTDDYAFTGSTDLEGGLEVARLSSRAPLTFSYTGYQTRHFTYAELARARGRVALAPSATELTAAVVVGRTDAVARELPWTVAVVTEADIAATQPQTTADALERSGEVYVQRSQMGGGSPIVRGFEANRVLLVVDGVRLNNAVYRAGHLQSAITVDPNMLDRAEVIFGAGSLLYGSDALGGVVHLRTREPRLAVDGAERSSGHYLARFSTANLEKTAHFDYNLGRRTWASETSVSVSSFADLRAGRRYNHAYTAFGQRPYYVAHTSRAGEVCVNDDPFLQRGTGYDQIDLMQQVKARLGRDRYLLANAQYSTSTEVPRYDQLSEVAGDRASDLKFAEWYYGPQRRLLGSLRYVSTAPQPLSDRLTVIGAYQRIDEDRYDRRLDAMWRNFSLVDVDVYSLTVDAERHLGAGRRHRLGYGLEGQHNAVASLGGRVHLYDERVLLDQISRYPSGGSTMSSGGAYLNYRATVADSTLHLQAGARYSAVALAAAFGTDDPVHWPQELLDGVANTNHAATYALGATYELTRATRVQALVSTAFRAPNVDDFGAMRIKNGYVTVPNVGLRPELARNLELTLTQDLGRFGQDEGLAARASVTGFYSAIDDVIVRTLGSLPGGDTTFVSGGDVYRVQSNTNAARGEVLGLGGRLDASYGQGFAVEARATVTHGTAYDRDDVATPLAHVPPLYGQVRTTYTFGRYRAIGVYRFNGAKAWVDYAPAGSSDNEDKAIPELGTPAWSTLNAYLNARLGRHVSLEGGVENLADFHYRPFSSGVSAPGRNFIVSVRGSF